MQVYKAITAVQNDLAKSGIAKDRKNDQQGYKFRGIDDVYNALSPVLSAHGLCILPRMLSRTVTERESARGGAIFSVVVEAEFDLIAAEDGSKHTIRTFGEAMDSGDKATNKAMSAAYKYAAMQAFAIPTEGDNDADATTHAVAAKKPESAKTVQQVAWEAQDRATQDRLRERAEMVRAFLVDGADDDAWIVYDETTADADERAAFRHLFDSKERSRLKAASERAKKVPA